MGVLTSEDDGRRVPTLLLELAATMLTIGITEHTRIDRRRVWLFLGWISYIIV